MLKPDPDETILSVLRKHSSIKLPMSSRGIHMQLPKGTLEEVEMELASLLEKRKIHKSRITVFGKEVWGYYVDPPKPIMRSS